MDILSTAIDVKAYKKLAFFTGIDDNLTNALILRTYFYAIISFLALLAISMLSFEGNILVYILGYILFWGRCNEIWIAFIKDALDKTTVGRKSKSKLTYRKRIELSLISYVELMFNFAIIYYVMPSEYFSREIASGIDAIYFSGVTITTLGYGEIHPSTWMPKLLVVQEVLVGFSLLIVSFAIYAGKER